MFDVRGALVKEQIIHSLQVIAQRLFVFMPLVVSRSFVAQSSERAGHSHSTGVLSTVHGLLEVRFEVRTWIAFR